MSSKKKVIEMPSDQYKNCSNCNHRLLICDNFSQKKNGRVTKWCLSCLEKKRERRKKNKCPHNREKYQCKDCGGSQICPHNKQKSRCKVCGGASICQHDRERHTCKVCGGASICQHNRRRNDCKDCGGIGICQHDKRKRYCKICSDPVEVTLKRMITSCRRTDKKLNLYDADRFIDYCFLEGLVEDYPCCYWDDCKITLQYLEYKDDLATIERLDNSIGHIKSNCVLACMRCNKLKKSNQ